MTASSSILHEWVNQYSDSLYTWACYKTSDPQLAEDLVQDTFLVACKTMEQFRQQSEPKTWLFSILKNKIADHFRQQSRSVVQTTSVEPDVLLDFFEADGTWKAAQRPVEWPDADVHLLDQAGFRTVLWQCMGKLPPAGRLAMQQKYLEAKASELICQELQITATNYWQLLHRAKLQLRKCLEKNWFKP
jgi:RNA polymerase sigma-70 factor (ECF subfamily)